VDGIDAFKKRTEVTHKIQTMQEVEAELMALLDEVQTKYIDAEARVIIEDAEIITEDTNAV
jgi:predicted HAD superfamily phosphohydrolase